MAILTKQELHQLAMNVVGEWLETEGFEFLGVNSKLKKNPQFVALRDKKLHFVVVRAVTYPDNPENYDQTFMKGIKEHGEKFKAQTFYAGVGIANSKDFRLPVVYGEDYVINYKGWQKI